MTKNKVKRIKKELIQEWSDFYRTKDQGAKYGRTYDDDLKTTDENYERFGEIMYEVIYQLGNKSTFPDLLDDPFPEGTEDRSWYRVFATIYKIGGDWKINLLEGMDNGIYFSMLLDFYEVGLINRTEVADTLDWAPRADKKYKHIKGRG